ncbi:MAG: tyrosine-type recombinase/integrase [Ilumatobacteraceae bacterium]
MSAQQFDAMKDGIGSYTVKNGERRWRVLYRLNGRQLSKGGFRTRGEAKAWRDMTRNEVNQGGFVNPTKGRKPFSEYARDWLAAPPKPLRPSTRAVYESMLKKHLKVWADVPLANITESAVRRWVADLRQTPKATRKQPAKDQHVELLSESTVAKQYRLLHRILGSAVREGYIRVNPCTLDVTEHSAERPCPTPAEVLKLATKVPDKYRALILLAGFGGTRWGEAIALRRRHLRLTERAVRVEEAAVELVDGTLVVGEPKTEAGVRTIYVPDVVVDALTVHLARHAQPGPDGLLFAGDEGEYLRRSNFRDRVWLKAVKAAGLTGVRFHDLRHAAATLTAQAGVTTAELMRQIGHSTPRAAMRYQHAADDRMKAVPDLVGRLIAEEQVTATGTDNVIPFRRRT